MSNAMESDPSIYHYDEYRAYLRDVYRAKKERGRGFSFRSFSRKAGFTSPNYLKLVMDGVRNLSDDGAERFARALSLDRDQARYFKHLVRFNQAATSDDRIACAERMVRLKSYQHIHPLAQAQFLYFSRWYYIAVREMVAFPHFKSDPEWIARHTLPAITPLQAKEALDALERLGLIACSEEGRYTQSSALVTSGDEIISPSLVQYHRDMLRLASESIDRVASSGRELSANTVALSKENLEVVKALVRGFSKEVLAIADQAQQADGVYHIGTQVFPITSAQTEKTK